MPNKNIIKSVARLVAVLAVLISTILIMLNCSFGWFAKNTTVNGNGMAIKAKGMPFETQYYDGTAWQTISADESLPLSVWFNKSEIFPGDTATVQIRVINTSTESYKLTDFGLRLQTASDETPLVKGEEHYHLGSQISAVVGNTPETDPDSDHEVIHSIWDDTTSSGTISLNGDGEITLAPSAYHDFTFSLAFVDTGIDQNIYRGFGSQADGSKGICKRAIYYTWEQA